ncbi:MAG: ribonuclease H-like domain-containing protein [Planctomycetota bacterium]|jgi:uncharacterized protein YprB with RNaseH-like and TPR domain|nr:ribonuclease H-like domain-containing protein [Planctomycetota bacterium]
MLTASFIFAKGITEEMERAIWGRGVTSWATLRKHSGEAAEAIGETRAAKLVAAVGEAQEALDKGDHAWFKNHWPDQEYWRLWRGLCPQEQIALVDIETTGRTPGYDQITVIGLSDGAKELAFVADRPLPPDELLSKFPEVMKQNHLLITFNGVSFDVPFIEKHFRDIGFHFDQPHIDLMWPARSIGLTGGLKDMEKQIGISRDGDIAEMRGTEAITLWGQWKQGDRAAYDRLVTYCKADCTNLKDFADHVYQTKWDQIYTPYAKDVDLDAACGEQLSLF